MKRWVDFIFGNRTTPVRGFEGGALPIDKAAELVLSSTAHPVLSVTVHFGPRPEDGYGDDEMRDDEQGVKAPWVVVATSETHIGGPGATTRIDGGA